MNGSESIMRLICVCLIAVTILIVPQRVSGEEDLSGLSEAQVLDQFHRKEYKEEYFRRLAGYSAKERKAAMEKFEDFSSRRKFPQEFSGDELLEFLLVSDDTNPVYKAVQELQKRYDDASPEEYTELAELLRAEYRVVPYPRLVPDTSNRAEASANQARYSRIDHVVRELLPEELALDIFCEVYLDSGQMGAITTFLSRICGVHFRGSATLAKLEELRSRVATYDRDELGALGEHEAVKSMVHMAIRDCSDNSFEVLKARDWQKNDLDIYAMGSFDNPEARKLLLQFYDTIPKDWLSSEDRLRVLDALIIRWDREHDDEVRALLRRELSELLKMDHKANIYYLQRTAEVIGQTRDPYYLPHLIKRRAGVEAIAIQKAAPWLEGEIEQIVQRVQRDLGDAIKTLEEVQQKELR